MSVAQQDPLMTQNANVVDLEDRRHAVDCQSDVLVRDPSDTEMRQAFGIPDVVNSLSLFYCAVNVYACDLRTHYNNQ